MGISTPHLRILDGAASKGNACLALETDTRAATPRATVFNGSTMSLQFVGEYPISDDDRVIPFSQWCALNSFSKDTGRRIVERGEIACVQLSLRRRGITVAENRRWRASRTRTT